MRTFLIIAMLLLVVMIGCSPKSTPGKTEEEHAKFWLTDFAAAKKIAKEQQKPILVDFSGSDWCGWCIKLDKEVFSQKEFLDYAKENLILLMLDFPKKKKLPAEQTAQNEKLLKEYDVKGFPTVLLLDGEGKLLGETGYREGGPKAYVSHIQELLAKKK